jgi:hypothetical protein
MKINSIFEVFLGVFVIILLIIFTLLTILPKDRVAEGPTSYSRMVAGTEDSKEE